MHGRQGFQCMVGMDDGWGAVGRDVIELLRDGFPRATILTFGLANPRRPQGPVRCFSALLASEASMATPTLVVLQADAEARLAHTTLSLSWLANREAGLSSLFVPVQPCSPWPAHSLPVMMMIMPATNPLLQCSPD